MKLLLNRCQIYKINLKNFSQFKRNKNKFFCIHDRFVNDIFIAIPKDIWWHNYDVTN